MRSLSVARDWFKNRTESRAQNTLLERVRAYRCRMPIYFETEDFIVRSARDGYDLQKVLELRHEIFVEEWQGRHRLNGLDIDDFDFIADHLLIISQENQEIVGTYRLIIHDAHGDACYSQSEFNLDGFLKIPGRKLELGRACIQKRFRDGNTIDLLWKGLARYIEKSKAQYLFGCSSVRTIDPDLIAALIRHIRAKDGFGQAYNVMPTEDYLHLDFDFEAGQELVVERSLIPPLLRSYLLAGAKIYGAPAYDHEFACFDLFTVLDLKDLTPRFRSRYFMPEIAGYIGFNRQDER